MRLLCTLLLFLITATGVSAQEADTVAVADVPAAAEAEAPDIAQLATALDSMPAPSAELPPMSLNSVPEQPPLSAMSDYEPHRGADFRLFKSVTNPATRPYTFLEDQSWSGIPIFLAGLLVRGERTAFRQNYKNPNTKIRLIKYNFHNKIDNYTQFLPLALTMGLHLGGYEGRSDWPRWWASAAMSAAIMAGFVNGFKYTVKEMRPDGSTRNSWPSGHTATAFMAATILHKEYGLTRSPWFSVGGYAVATATGVMRVLNNRHWISDVLSGAGIGILSTELAYGITDLLFKGRGLLRNDLSVYPDLRANPSFFNISMGIGFGNRHLTLPAIDYNLPEELGGEEPGVPLELKFRMATAVGAEAAWFFCPYVGVGGRLRVKSTPINGWNNFALSEQSGLNEFMKDPELESAISRMSLTVESDHLTEFAADAGVYFSYPLTSRFALGTKLLFGRSVMNALDVTGTFAGKQLDFNSAALSDETQSMFKTTDKDVQTAWDYINVDATNSFKLGSGISLTYAHKNAFSWRVFCDYDFSRKTFTATYNPLGFMSTLSPDFADLAKSVLNFDVNKPFTSATKKSLHQWVLGAALCVCF